jgi:hypothetical protein
VNVEQPSCNGFSDGCVGVLLDGLPPVSTVWTNQGQLVATCSLPAGVYEFEALASSGCAYTGSVELIDPEVLALSVQSVTICSDATAAAQWEANGGTGTYSFSVSGGADLENLSPGEYTGIVTDANGCSAQDNFTIGSYPAINFIASADSICSGDVTSLQYFGFGGTLPYTFDWQGQNPSALPAGDYTFTLTDGNGCTDEAQVQVASYPALEIVISEILNSNGGDNGSIALTIGGGEPPYSILWNTGDTTALLDSIGPGIYSVLVTDANECEATATQNIVDLGIAEFASQVELFPNPVERELSIRTKRSGHYEMFDAAGACVLNGRLLSGMNAIDIHSLRSGFYFILIVSDDQSQSYKVMKR